MRDLGVGALKLCLEARKLQRREIGARHAFGAAVEHGGQRVSGGLRAHARTIPGKGRCSVAASGDPKTPKPLIGARLVLAPQPRDLRCDRSRPDYLFFLGTFLPFLRALERPMAMACWRLLTLPPLPP